MSIWQYWFSIVGIIILLYVARPHLHRFLRSAFYGTAHFLSKMSKWLSENGTDQYKQLCETLKAHKALEYEKKLENHKTNIKTRIQTYDVKVNNLTNQLANSCKVIDEHTKGLGNINLSETAMNTIESGLSDTSLEDPYKSKRAADLAKNLKRSIAHETQKIRPLMISIEAELKPIDNRLSKLTEITNEFSLLAKKANDDMDKFNRTLKSEDRKSVAEKESIIIPWLLALLVMTVALSGVFLNFFLIERPMAEIVGDGIRVAGLPLPSAAALVVILLEAVAGIVLMDSSGMTALTTIHSANRKVRKIFFWIAFGFLSAFSMFEAMLAVQREVIIAAEACVEATAVGLDCAGEETGLNLAMTAQILLAILIPWLLAIAAIPLETLVQNFTFILRTILHQIIMLLSYLLKTIAAALRALCVFLLSLYDLIIFLPLAIEKMIKSFALSKKVEA